tara:strand:+ start:1192 stop:3000 length:1809 start_codon:yes stop_codon:yes gene_type:complete
MAEIAIPLVALGATYIIAKHEREKNEPVGAESFTNMGRPANDLPGVSPPVPAINYPKTTPLSKRVKFGVNKYPNPNQATDKYFNANVYEKIAETNPPGSVGSGIQPVIGLNGQPINKSNFKHNNMVPFFGGKIKGATLPAESNETILDNLQGSGSQMIRKVEQAPLFAPQKQMSFAHGTPNMTSFYQSRVNPGMKIANVKPWEECRVAPGLGQGYTTGGGAGFNSGMEARDSWLPKTVNQLRYDTNPKLTFGLDGHQGPALAPITASANIKTQGNVEKYAPDTYYSSGPNRWFTTTGLEKAPTARGIEVLQDQNRGTTCDEYFGAGGNDGEATYVKGEYIQSRRPELGPSDINHAHNKGSWKPSAGDFGAKSYQNLPNNRSSTRQADEFGAVNGMFKAMVAPVLDVLRPSRKENVIGNLRPTGNAHTTVSNAPVFNPADRTRTTIREMTEGAADGKYLNIEGQSAGAYTVTKNQPITNQRDSTSRSYIGDAGPGNNGRSAVYNAAYNQRNNPNKTSINRPNQGGTQIFNQEENICISSNRGDCNDRANIINGGPHAAPSMDTYGKINTPQYYDQCQGCERISPDILTAFKDNPYTQSLQSWA